MNRPKDAIQHVLGSDLPPIHSGNAADTPPEHKQGSMRDRTGQDISEEALKAHQANLDAIFEASPVALLILDESTNVIAANQAAVDVCGCDKSHIMHHRPGEAINCIHSTPAGCGHGPDCPLCPVRRGIEGLIDRTGGVIKDAEVQMSIRRDGKEQNIWLQVSAVDLVLNSKRAICVSLLDITARKRTEVALQFNKDLLAETELIGKVGGWSFNIDTMMQVWTDEVFHIHEVEISPNPTVQAGINYYTPESRPIIENAVRRAIEHGEGFNLELEIITAKGNRRAVHTIGRADLKNRRVYGFFQDITERKRAEKGLQKAEALAHATLDALSAHIAIINEAGFIVTVNRAWRQFADDNPPVSSNVCEGANYLEVCGRAASEAPEAAEVASAIRSILHGTAEKFQMEYTCHSPEEQRWFIVRVTRFHDFIEPLVAIAHENITERKEADEALRRKEEQLNETGRIAKVGGWELHVESKHLTWTDETKRIHEVASDYTPTLETAIRFYHPESQPIIAALVQRAIETGQPFDSELRLITASGSEKWVRAQGVAKRSYDRVLSISGAFQDITERKKTEEALLKKERDLGESQRLAKVGSWHLNVSTNEIVWSQELYRLYGADPSLPPPIFSDSAKLFTPESWEKLRNAIAKAIEEKIPYELELQTVRKDGSTGWMWARGELELDSKGNVVGLWGAVQDITERKQSDEKLKKALHDLQQAQKQIVQQERMSALGQMASGIAHDFNNILMPVLGFSEILLSQPDALDDREEARHMLEMIHSAGEDARHMVRRLRAAYATDTERKLDSIDISRIVESALSMTMPKWKEEVMAKGAVVEMVTDFQPVPQINGRASELREVIINLIFNSVDAMPHGGSMTFRIYPENSTYVVLEIADTGMGMDQSTLDRCLEPFFSTKGPEGSGLGLPIVNGIVERHGGTLNISSQPGAGTTVRMRFPVPINAAAPVKEQIKEPSPVASKKILVLDDEARSVNYLKTILQKDGHQVEAGGNGREGLDKLRNGHFDMIITDRAMPVMDGAAFAKEAQKIQPGIPIIMLTGFGDIMNDSKELPPGVSLVISKPVMWNDLRTAISKLIS